MMRSLILLTLLLTSCTSHLPVNQQKPERPKEFKLVIPKATWEPIFFQAIEARAAIAGLPSLQTVGLPDGDLEIRLWQGFGLSPLDGFVLKRSEGQWSAIFMKGLGSKRSSNGNEIVLQAPKSGWDGLWQQLLDKGILTLEDAEAIGCSGGAMDGISFVVEYNIDNTYRTYMYDNPEDAECAQAKKMIEIVEIFGDEFGPQYLDKIRD
jgi:hypothetical protein